VNILRAWNAGALEAAVAALRRHTDEMVQMSVCMLLQILTYSSEESRTIAASAGAIEAVVRAMRMHPKIRDVQLAACKGIVCYQHRRRRGHVKSEE
jgi:imidazoleglycerol phosphate synthase glutamine amidotransferase subunit HisH